MSFAIQKSDIKREPVITQNTGIFPCGNLKILPESQAGMVKTYGDELL